MSEIVIENEEFVPKPYIGDTAIVLLRKFNQDTIVSARGWIRAWSLLDGYECFYRTWDGTEPQIHSFYTTPDIEDDRSRTVYGGAFVAKRSLG